MSEPTLIEAAETALAWIQEQSPTDVTGRSIMRGLAAALTAEQERQEAREEAFAAVEGGWLNLVRALNSGDSPNSGAHTSCEPGECAYANFKASLARLGRELGL